MAATYTDSSYADVAEEAAIWLVAGGILTMALAPLAIPLIALTAAALIPFLLLPLAIGLVVGVVAVPILVIRSLWRRATGGRLHLPAALKGSS